MRRPELKRFERPPLRILDLGELGRGAGNQGEKQYQNKLSHSPTPKRQNPQMGILSFVAGVGFEPTTFRLCIPLQFSLPPCSHGVRGLDYTFTLLSSNKEGARRLVSTPFRLTLLADLARYYLFGFHRL